MKSSLRSDEVQGCPWMKSNPQSCNAGLHRESDFIHASGFNPSRTDLIMQATACIIRPICIRNCTRQKQSFSLPPSLCDTSLIRWRQVLSLECSARYDCWRKFSDEKGANRPRMHFGTVYCIKPTIFCQYIFSFLLIFSENVMAVVHKIQQIFLKK